MKALDPDLPAMRKLHEHGIMPSRGLVNRMVRRGHARRSGSAVLLTQAGEDAVNAYVAKTGDGPEDLKAMFRF